MKSERYLELSRDEKWGGKWITLKSGWERKATACVLTGLWNQEKKIKLSHTKKENPLDKTVDTMVRSAEEGNLQQNSEVTTSDQLYTGKQPSQEVTTLLWGQIH